MANNRLVILPGGSAGVIFGVYDVFGTNNANETVRLFNGGTAFLQGDFGRGGDIIQMGDVAADYTVRLVGSNVVFTSVSDGITAYVPMTVSNTVGTTISFEDASGNYVDSRALRFDGTNVVLGTQVITGTEATVNPVAAPQQSGLSAFAAEPVADEPAAQARLAEPEIASLKAIDLAPSDDLGGSDVAVVHFSTPEPVAFDYKAAFELGMTSAVVHFA